MRMIDADILVQDTIQEYARSKQYRDAIIRMVNKAPTIEPKRGEWVNQHKWPNGFFERECSVCGAMKPLLRCTAKINFCPNCGADMRGADDE